MKAFHQTTIFVATILVILLLDPGNHLLQSVQGKELRCTGTGHLCNLSIDAIMDGSCYGDNFVYGERSTLFGNCRFDIEGYVFGGCHYCPETHDPPVGNASSLAGPCRAEDGYYLCGDDDNCVRRSSMNDIRTLIQPCQITKDTFANNGSLLENHFIKIDCTDDEIECKIHPRCMKRYEVGTYLGCDNEGVKHPIYIKCHEETEYKCPKSGRCIPRNWVNDGSPDCSFNKKHINDTSDEETSLTCHPETEFRCHTSGRCIPREWVMNTIDECGDGSDELRPLTCDPKTEFQCATGGRCLPRYRVNDGYPDCADRSDHDVKNFTCSANEFTCEVEKRCIPRAWVGNGIRDCHQTGADEATLLSVCIEDVEFGCRDGRRCIPHMYLCDGVRNCADGSDEAADVCELGESMFKCGDGETVPWAYTCDGTADCRDDSDETTPRTPGFRCPIDGTEKKCLRPQLLLQNTPLIDGLCSNDWHKCFDSNGALTTCSRCLDNVTIIARTQICDGVVDCPDASDECTCLNTPATELCTALLRSPKTPLLVSSTQRPLGFHNLTKYLCDGKDDFIGGVDEKYCYKHPTTPVNVTKPDYLCSNVSANASGLVLKIKQYATKCNGIIECPWKDDECGAGCEKECNRTNFYDDASRMCLQDTVLAIVQNRQICDGRYDCDDRSDEANCSEQDKYFECEVKALSAQRGFVHGTQRWILKEKLCDFKADCVGNVDELNCPETHFYCDYDKTQFCRKSQVLDGFFDCSDKSDECPHLNSDSEGYGYASPHELIKSTALQALIWLTSTIAILGNLSVLVITARKLKKLRSKKNSVPYCNRLLIFHLALADFLMGVSLYILAFKSRQLSGDYCAQDPFWRSSSQCSVIGFLTVLSSQTSLNILVVLTGARLLVVVRRRHTQRVVSFRLCWFLIGASWFLALLFAAVPLMHEPLHRARVHIEKNLFFGGDRIDIARQDMDDYTDRTSAMISTPTLNKTRFPLRDVRVIGYFGYYGSESVCLPDYYSTRAPTSQYSFAVISYNFIALVFITVSYVLINMSSLPYRSGSLRRRSSVTLIREKATLRRRTALLVATNVACWLPVCFCSMLAFGGVPIHPILYPITQVLLIPINSCVNPIIYSLLLQRLNKLISRNKKKIIRVFTWRDCTQGRQHADECNQADDARQAAKETSCCCDDDDDDDDDDDYDAPITAETHL